MRSNWIALLGLSVIALGGCSTVKNTIVGTTHRTVLQPVVNSEESAKNSKPTKTESNNSDIGLVVFQQDADDADSLELEPAGEQATKPPNQPHHPPKSLVQSRHGCDPRPRHYPQT